MNLEVDARARVVGGEVAVQRGGARVEGRGGGIFVLGEAVVDVRGDGAEGEGSVGGEVRVGGGAGGGDAG